MNKEEANELKESISTNIKEEIERLIYDNPSCDFEHAWNVAVDKASECCNGYEARIK